MNFHIAAKQTATLLSLAMIILGLNGCGFHLRGNIEVPEAFQRITLNANPNSSFTKTLVEQLKANDVKIVSDSSTLLFIDKDRNDRRTISYSGRGKSAEYEIIKEIAFKVVQANNNVPVIDTTTLQAQRTLIVDDTKVSSMQEQERIMRQEMEFDLANKLLVRLQKTPLASN